MMEMRPGPDPDDEGAAEHGPEYGRTPGPEHESEHDTERGDLPVLRLAAERAATGENRVVPRPDGAGRINGSGPVNGPGEAYGSGPASGAPRRPRSDSL